MHGCKQTARLTVATRDCKLLSRDFFTLENNYVRRHTPERHDSPRIAGARSRAVHRGATSARRRGSATAPPPRTASSTSTKKVDESSLDRLDRGRVRKRRRKDERIIGRLCRDTAMYAAPSLLITNRRERTRERE